MARLSRELNKKSIFLGLGFPDIIGISILFLVLQIILNPLGKELYALPIAMVSLLVLVPLRLNFRQGIIQDLLNFYFERRVHVLRKHSNDE